MVAGVNVKRLWTPGIILRQQAKERMVKKAKSPGRLHSACGLKNLGNSCYISAVIQCLATIDGHGIGLVCEDPKKQDRNS